MRPLSLVFFSLIMLTGAAFGQTKTVGKAVIKTPTVLCDVCKDQLEFFLSHEYGISSVAVNIQKKTTTVTWLTDRTNLETVKVTIANLGFDADDIEAEETAFKRLPKTCRAHKTIVKPAVPLKEK
ncbi:MAG: copper chaperone [Chitinophagaceae bacterium]|nr:copper chaperone [Chitinophagaceae bacterium]MBL0057014.1 copper chaperone [Chitinophagaceae bacterium]